MVIITINLRANNYYRTSTVSSLIYSEILGYIYSFIFHIPGLLGCFINLYPNDMFLNHRHLGCKPKTSEITLLTTERQWVHKDWRSNSSWSPFSVQSCPPQRLIERRAVAAILDHIPFQFSPHERNAFSSQGEWTGSYKSPLDVFPSGLSICGEQDSVLV